jgi:DNA replication protein DnaC
MLHQQTVDRLYDLKLHGMADAYQEQQRSPHSLELPFDDRFAQLVERQWLWKEDRALQSRLHYAHLKHNACLEDIDYHHRRGLQRAVIEQLASGEWIRYHRHCLITGPTGVGKSFLACALAHTACRQGHRALYCYIPKLFRALTVAQGDGSLARMLTKLARVNLLVCDDWGLIHLEPDQYRLFLEILEDRLGTGSMLLTSQYPVSTWHAMIGDQTVADAILDRLVHNAQILELKGESLRKQRPAAPKTD